MPRAEVPQNWFSIGDVGWYSGLSVGGCVDICYWSILECVCLYSYQFSFIHTDMQCFLSASVAGVVELPLLKFELAALLNTWWWEACWCICVLSNTSYLSAAAVKYSSMLNLSFRSCILNCCSWKQLDF